MSSAKSLTLDLSCSGRSFMYARKRIGPRTEPCGTPEEIEILSEFNSINYSCLFSIVQKVFYLKSVSPDTIMV